MNIHIPKRKEKEENRDDEFHHKINFVAWQLQRLSIPSRNLRHVDPHSPFMLLNSVLLLPQPPVAGR